MSGTKYDDLLAENKARYDRGEIDKDTYQKNARKLRRSRRNAVGGEGGTTKKAPGTTTTKRKKRKAKAVAFTPVPREQLVTELKEDFSHLEFMAEVPSSLAFHAVTFTSLMKGKMADAESRVGSKLLEKFKARWLTDPEWWSIYKQGDEDVYCLGPVKA